MASNVITTRTSPESLIQLERVYSFDEVCHAVETARAYIPLEYSVYTDPVEFENAWNVLHVLTSDCAWRGGVGCLVDSYLKVSVSRFVCDLIANTPALVMETMSAVNFMVREFDNMGDPGFIRLLRAYLFAFPALVDFQADEMPQRFINQNTDDIHNAVQMAANNEEVPSNILCVLLEFGADVNCTTSSGESSMMGAIANVSDRSLFKLNLLLHYGGNIDIFDQSFQTVLHYGAYAGNVHGVRLVLKSREQRLQITKYAVENLESGNGSSDESEKTSDVYSDDEEDRHETGSYGDTVRDPHYAEVTRRMYEDRLEVDMIHMDSPQTSFTPAMKYYAERLRLLSELYVDPLHLRDTCNHTPLSL